MNQREQFTSAGGPLTVRMMSHRGRDVPERREWRKQRIALEHHPDAPLMRRQAHAVYRVEPSRAAACYARSLRAVEARDGAQRRGFACARGSNQRKQLALIAGKLHRKRDWPRLFERDVEPFVNHAGDRYGSKA